MKFTEKQIREDCMFCMIEQRGLQFILSEPDKLRYLVWTRRSEEHKKLIRETVRKYEESDKERFD